MYAAITHVDKQSFPFSDVLRLCFYEIANHRLASELLQSFQIGFLDMLTGAGQ